MALLDRDETLEAATRRLASASSTSPPARHSHRSRPARPGIARGAATDASVLSATDLNEVVKKNCASCHSEQRKMGNLSLQSFDLATVGATAPIIAEKMIGKLRTGMMPPPGRPRPAGDTLLVLTETLERQMDAIAVTKPNIGNRAFQRLNRAEYERSILDMLGLEVNAESWLPLDTRSANFDNIADCSAVPRRAGGLPRRRRQISRLAVAIPRPASRPPPSRSASASQHDLQDGAPLGRVAEHPSAFFRPTASTCSR